MNTERKIRLSLIWMLSSYCVALVLFIVVLICGALNAPTWLIPYVVVPFGLAAISCVISGLYGIAVMLLNWP